MKLKHTPGPWAIDDIPYRENVIEIRDNRGKRICAVVSDFPQSPETQTANARLIAAAPEMLEALIYMCNLGYTCDNMTVAIERATGLSIEEVLEATE